jgi:hypothetical protein
MYKTHAMRDRRRDKSAFVIVCSFPATSSSKFSSHVHGIILGLGIRSCAIHHGVSAILVEKKNDGQRSVMVVETENLTILVK